MSEDVFDLVERYVELRDRQKRHEADAEAAKADADAIQDRLLDEFGSKGLDKLTAKGKTVYLHRQLWAGAAEGRGGDLVPALKAAGLGHMVGERCNTQTLSAYVRELEREERDLPDELADVVSVVERFTVRVRSA